MLQGINKVLSEELTFKNSGYQMQKSGERNSFQVRLAKDLINAQESLIKAMDLGLLTDGLWEPYKDAKTNIYVTVKVYHRIKRII